MLEGKRFAEIGLVAAFEEQTNVFAQGRLVVLGGEQVMRIALFDQVSGEITLGEQGIGGDGSALDVDGIEQRDGGLDFVGAFNFLVGYGQSTYFFWV